MSSKIYVRAFFVLLVAAFATVGWATPDDPPAIAVESAAAQQDKPNILVVWGDDIGQSNISYFTRGVMGYHTPNIDRIADEGMSFTDYYGEQSCTAGRSSFIMGQSVFRTGLSKVGLPGAEIGMREEDPTIATVLKDQGYSTGQFGKNHLGDRDEHLPTNHGFDEFFGNLYHLNAEEEPENEDYPGDMVLESGKTFREQYGPRGALWIEVRAELAHPEHEPLEGDTALPRSCELARARRELHGDVRSPVRRTHAVLVGQAEGLGREIHGGQVGRAGAQRVHRCTAAIDGALECELRGAIRTPEHGARQVAGLARLRGARGAQHERSRAEVDQGVRCPGLALRADDREQPAGLVGEGGGEGLATRQLRVAPGRRSDRGQSLVRDFEELEQARGPGAGAEVDELGARGHREIGQVLPAAPVPREVGLERAEQQLIGREPGSETRVALTQRGELGPRVVRGERQRPAQRPERPR